MKFEYERIAGQRYYREVGTRLVYPINGETAPLVADIKWAHDILAMPCVDYPNGRKSHEAAAQAMEAAMLGLIAHQAIA